MITQATLDAAQRLHLEASRNRGALARVESSDLVELLNAFWSLTRRKDSAGAKALSLIDEARAELLASDREASAVFSAGEANGGRYN